MLTDENRKLGHRLAGDWLERVGEMDPKLLAEHFDRGEDRPRAAANYLRAAEQTLESGDYVTTIRLSERGIELAQEPELVAALRAIEAETSFFNGDFQTGLRAAQTVLSITPQGSRAESRALRAGIQSALYLRDTTFFEDWIQRLLHTNPEPAAVGQLAAAFFSAIVSLIFDGQGRRVEAYLRHVEQLVTSVGDSDPIAAAWGEYSRALWVIHGERNFWSGLEHVRTAMSHYKRSGAVGALPFVRCCVPYCLFYVGAVDLAEEECRAIAPTVSPLEVLFLESTQAEMRLEQRRLDEASVLAASAIRAGEERGDKHVCFINRLVLAQVELHRGAIEAAESELLQLGEVASAHPYIGQWYLAVLARLRLTQRRAAEAAAIAKRAYAMFQASGIGFTNRHEMLLLVLAEALHALGDQDAAREVIREALGDLQRRAAAIPDLEVRRSFLQYFSDHRRTIELARQWLGEEACETT